MENYLVKEVFHYVNVNVSQCLEIPEEKIDFYDFTFVLSGEMTYTSNGVTYVLGKNDAIFLKPGTIRTREGSNESVKYVSFNFHLMPGVNVPFDDFIPNCISTDIRKLVSAFPQSRLSTHYHSEQKLANMLNYIIFEIMDVTSLNCNNEHVIKILRHIEENITKDLSLHVISEKINLTKEYTSHIFRREMGKSLTDYVNEKKMLYAKELILDREMSLTDIATHLGYSNYNYFSRLFKKHFNINPISLKNRA